MTPRRGSGPSKPKTSKSPPKGPRSASGTGGTAQGKNKSNAQKSSSENSKAPGNKSAKGPKATFPQFRPKKVKTQDVPFDEDGAPIEKGYQHPIQWYPGHVAKWDRALQERLKMVDVVVLVLDARLPYTTFDPELLKRLNHKPVMCLLNKRGLSDGHRLPQWISALEGDLQCPVMTYDAMERPPRDQLVRQLVLLGKPVIQKWVDKGLKARAVRAMIVGMPNVGKSTLLNSIVGRKKAQTGHKPGVTRDIQWVRIHSEVELMDSPGIIPPKLSHETVGFLLATVSAVSDAVYSEESVAQFLVDTVERIYPGRLRMHYSISDGLPINLESIASARSLLAKGGDVDILRAAKLVLLDFRQGRWGGLLLEDTPSPNESQN